MSRKGKNPIPLPKGVEIKHDGILVTVKGPKGTLQLKVLPIITTKVEDGLIVVGLTKEDPTFKKFHGLYRSLIANMVHGVTQGFVKSLKMIGVGYRANVKGRALDLQVGYSHPTELAIPEGISITVEENNTLIHVSGADKQQVGQYAADIRSMKPPEPYQGKGIRYRDEHVRRKAGKAAAKG